MASSEGGNTDSVEGQLRKDLQAKDATIAELKRKTTEFVGKLKEEMALKDNEIAQSNARLIQVKDKAKEFVTNIKTDHAAQIAELQSRLDNATRELAGNVNGSQSLAEENVALAEQLASEQASLGVKDRQIEELKALITTLQLDAQQKQQLQIENNQHDLDAKNKELQEVRIKYDAEIESLRKALSASSDKEIALEEQLKALEHRCKTAEDSANESLQKLSTVVAENSSTKSTFSMEQEQQLRQQLEELKEELKTAQSLAVLRLNSIEQKAQECNELAEKTANLEQTLLDSKSSAESAMSEALQQAEEKFVTLKQENDNMAEQIALGTAKITKIELDLACRDSEVLALQQLAEERDVKISSLGVELKTIAAKIEEIQEENKRLLQNIEDEKESNNKLSADLQSSASVANTKIEALLADRLEDESKIAGFEIREKDICARYEEKISYLEQSLKDLSSSTTGSNDKMEELEVALKASNAKVTDLQSQLQIEAAEGKEKVDSLSLARSEEIAKLTEQHRNSVEAIERQLVDSKVEVEQLRKNVTSLETQISNNDEELSSSSNTSEKFKSDIKSLEQTIASQGELVKTLESDLTLKETEIKLAKETSDAISSKLEEAEVEIEKLREEIRDLSIAESETNAKLVTSEERNVVLERLQAELAEKMSILIDENKTLVLSKTELELSRPDLEASLNAATESLSAAEITIKNLESSKLELNAKCEELERSQAANTAYSNSSIAAEVQELKASLLAEKTAYNTAQEKVVALESSIASTKLKLKGYVENLNAEKKVLEERLLESEKDLVEKRNSIEQISNEVSESVLKVVAAQSNIDRLTSLHHATQEELTSARAKVSSLEADIESMNSRHESEISILKSESSRQLAQIQSALTDSAKLQMEAFNSKIEEANNRSLGFEAIIILKDSQIAEVSSLLKAAEETIAANLNLRESVAVVKVDDDENKASSSSVVDEKNIEGDKVIELQSLLAEKEEIMTGMEICISEKDTEISELKLSSSARISGLEQDLIETKSNYEQFVQTSSSKEKEYKDAIAALEEGASLLKSSNEEDLQKLSNVQRTFDEISKQNSELKSSLVEFEAIGKLQGDRSSFEVTELTRKQAQLEASLAAKESQLLELSARLKDASASSDHFSSELNSLKLNFQRVSTELEESKSTNNELKKQLLVEQNQQKETKLKVKTYVDSLMTEKRSLEDTIQKLNHSHTFLQQQITNAEMKNSSLQDQLVVEQEKSKAAYATVERSFQGKFAEQSNIIETLRAQLSSTSVSSNDFAALQAKLKETQFELESHKSKRIVAKNEMVNAARILETTQRDSEELRVFIQHTVGPTIFKLSSTVGSLMSSVESTSVMVGKSNSKNNKDSSNKYPAGRPFSSTDNSRNINKTSSSSNNSNNSNNPLQQGPSSMNSHYNTKSSSLASSSSSSDSVDSEIGGAASIISNFKRSIIADTKEQAIMVKKEIDVLSSDVQSLSEAIDHLHETVLHQQNGGSSSAYSGMFGCLYDSCLCFRVSSNESSGSSRSFNPDKSDKINRIGSGLGSGVGILSMPVPKRPSDASGAKKGGYSTVSQDLDSDPSSSLRNDIEMLESSSSSTSASYSPPDMHGAGAYSSSSSGRK